jgi:hypothetical protein
MSFDPNYGGSFVVYKGEDRPIDFAPASSTNVSGWTFRVDVVDEAGMSDTVSIAHGSLTVTTGTGAITAKLTRAITSALRAGKYRVELWRIDSGYYGKLAWIYIEVAE